MNKPSHFRALFTIKYKRGNIETNSLLSTLSIKSRLTKIKVVKLFTSQGTAHDLRNQVFH